MSTSNPAFAEGDPPGMGGIVNVFEKLGEMFINIAYSLMIIVFAVGTVKSGLAAQAAQQFGASGRVSVEVMNIAGGVIIFVLGMLSLPIVKWILAELGDFVLTNVSLSDYIKVQ
jgi:hypothetical protein